MTLFSREPTEPKPFWFRRLCFNFIYHQYKIYVRFKKFLKSYIPILYKYVFNK